MEVVVLIVYGLALLFIFMYSVVQIQLVYHYVKGGNKQEQGVCPPTGETIINSQDHSITTSPDHHITIQLPVYNEKYVVERLINCVCELDYPKDKLEIQVLDDSTDETKDLVNALVQQKQEMGLNIVHLHREDRKGFKAGALAYGLEQAKGEFIAIFDADFLPSPDFLKKTMPSFTAETGMVQTRWAHINKEYSLLTRLQAFGLDAHFTVEQSGRNRGGHFINFNGTAGIWRRACIEDAGGWQADTLTEDLDLSYRAQLKGWKFKYREDCSAPAELPAHIQALKTQQYRWTKGAAECSRKNLGSLLRSSQFSFSTKLNAIFHLLNSSVFICILITSILTIPILQIKHQFPVYAWLYELAGLFLLGVIFLIIFYFTAYLRSEPHKPLRALRFIYRFPLFLAVSMGLSLHNGIAALEGLIGIKTPFVRTPKFNIKEKGDGWSLNNYVRTGINRLTWIELLLTLYFCFGLYWSVRLDDFGLFPFLLMLTFGYGYVSMLSISHAVKR